MTGPVDFETYTTTVTGATPARLTTNASADLFPDWPRSQSQRPGDVSGPVRVIGADVDDLDGDGSE